VQESFSAQGTTNLDVSCRLLSGPLAPVSMQSRSLAQQHSPNLI
jgi:hypothetical protein